MAGTDHDNIVAFRIGENITHFPMQKVLKILLRTSSVTVFPVISPMEFRVRRSCWATISRGCFEMNISIHSVKYFSEDLRSAFCLSLMATSTSFVPILPE